VALSEVRAASLGVTFGSQSGEISDSAQQVALGSPLLSPASARRELWEDRLGHQDESPEENSNHLSVHVDNYLRKERLRVDSGGISVGRFSAKRNNLLRFLDWAGKTTSIEAINSKLVQDFHWRNPPSWFAMSQPYPIDDPWFRHILLLHRILVSVSPSEDFPVPCRVDRLEDACAVWETLH